MAKEKGYIITIDGPAGSGKSTLARGLARELGITYLSTGATYRALALESLREGIDPEDEIQSAELAGSVSIEFRHTGQTDEVDRVILNGEDVTEDLSSNEVSIIASKISKHPDVRKALVKIQRKMANAALCRQDDDSGGVPGVVLEGRDTGTVVFPDADVKFYLVATLDERAKRRMTDFDPGKATIEIAKVAILSRDISDIKREASPLVQAEDAIRLDNTGWEIEDTLSAALEIVRERLNL